MLYKDLGLYDDKEGRDTGVTSGQMVNEKVKSIRFVDFMISQEYK